MDGPQYVGAPFLMSAFEMPLESSTQQMLYFQSKTHSLFAIFYLSGLKLRFNRCMLDTK